MFYLKVAACFIVHFLQVSAKLEAPADTALFKRNAKLSNRCATVSQICLSLKQVYLRIQTTNNRQLIHQTSITLPRQLPMNILYKRKLRRASSVLHVCEVINDRYKLCETDLHHRHLIPAPVDRTSASAWLYKHTRITCQK